MSVGEGATFPSDLLDPRDLPSLAGLLPDLARTLGVEDVPATTTGRDLPTAERVCVVLVDGMGWEALLARTGHAPTLRGLVQGAHPLHAGYPSTTAASLGAFGTGLGAGRTGLLGYTVRDPRQVGPEPGLVNLVSWTATADEASLDPRAWQRHRTVFEQLVAAGVAVTSVGPARFVGSGLTLAALRGATAVGAERLADRVDAAVRALRAPGLAYLYWGDVDKAGHHHGWGSPVWAEELGAFDYELRRLLRRLTPGTLVVVTADHGMVDVTDRLDVADHPALFEGVAIVAGEPRASHVHLESGADVEAAASRWRETLGERAWVLTRDQALGLGLFGPVDPGNLALVGDLVVPARGTHAIVDSRTQTPASLQLVGMHGSLTSAELAVPALVEVV